MAGKKPEKSDVRWLWGEVAGQREALQTIVRSDPDDAGARTNRKNSIDAEHFFTALVDEKVPRQKAGQAAGVNLPKHQPGYRKINRFWRENRLGGVGLLLSGGLV
jgi:hypothetical protein